MSLMISVSGVRGIVAESLTPQIAGRFAAAFGARADSGLVIIARDSRPSGDEILQAVGRQLRSAGCPVIDLAVATTPGTALQVIRHGAAGGIVVTASHNPSQWNGLKFFTPQGTAPPGEWVLDLGRESQGVACHEPDEQSLAALHKDDSADQTHVAAVLDRISPQDVISRGLRVVLDSVNGAGCVSGKMLLEGLGCEVIQMNGEPHGHFAHAPEPVQANLTGLCDTVRQTGAHVGFAQDPDADRLAIVDESGRYIGEEYTLALAAKYVFDTTPGPAAANLSTSRMIDDLAASGGDECVVHRSAVGEANVVKCMLENGCVIGGEGNGGLIEPRVVPVRDSLSAMGIVLQLLVRDKRPMSEIVDAIPHYTMIKSKLQSSRDQIGRARDKVRQAFRNEPIDESDGVRIDWPEGWAHLRGSNTEPIMRLIVEAPDPRTAERLAQRVTQAAGIS